MSIRTRNCSDLFNPATFVSVFIGFIFLQYVAINACNLCAIIIFEIKPEFLFVSF